MWCFRGRLQRGQKLLLAAVLSAAVAGCGFTPAYGPDGGAQQLQGQIEVAAPDGRGRDAYLITRRLEERLGRSGTAARYRLEYTRGEAVAGLAITADGKTTRYNLIGWVDYRLIRQEDGAVVEAGKVENFAAYSATGTTVATLAAERDARERLAILLADQMVDRFLLAAPRFAKQATP